MSKSLIATLWRGAKAGVFGATVQVMVGKAEEKLLLPPWEDADIAPRFVHRLGLRAGVDMNTPARWVLGTAYHYSYGAAWGALYAVARERWRFHPVLGGLALGGLIYGITFPSWGTAVQTGTERPPEQRTSAMEVVAVSVAIVFGLATALAYERMAHNRR